MNYTVSWDMTKEDKEWVFIEADILEQNGDISKSKLYRYIADKANIRDECVLHVNELSNPMTVDKLVKSLTTFEKVL